jgi:nucleoside-diphosphate-sugar epimerase
VITSIGELVSHITGKTSALNRDKYNILKQRNWRCNIEPAMDELGYHPQYNLEKGVELTIKWYKENGWI